MLAAIHSAGLHGIEAFPVTVEVDYAAQGLPGWHLVGLPETAVRESKDRVTAALRNAGFRVQARKTTINLAPARRKKTGNHFDLPIAVGLLVAAQVLTPDALPRHLFLGELMLSGALHAVPGALSMAIYARDHGFTVIAPAGNAAELHLVRGLRFFTAAHLSDVHRFLTEAVSAETASPPPLVPSPLTADLAEVKGQPVARRAIEIAAAGHHHLLMIGPPGCGKSMLAQRLPGLLPALTYDEALEATRITTIVAGQSTGQLVVTRPFRAPHHTASAAGMVGGGAHPQAGEMSLAHHGILFLDELAEFPRPIIEVLRQPLEEGTVTIARANGHARFPARFLLVAATNPCRCGFLGHPTMPCRCTIQQIQSYRAKLSGPLLDRIDLHVPLQPLTADLLTSTATGEASASVRERIVAARARQAERYRHHDVVTNGQLDAAATRRYCLPTSEARQLLIRAIEKQGLSARAFDRVLRVARTIADLAAAESITATHVAEAIQYRSLDRPL